MREKRRSEDHVKERIEKEESQKRFILFAQVLR